MGAIIPPFPDTHTPSMGSTITVVIGTTAGSILTFATTILAVVFFLASGSTRGIRFGRMLMTPTITDLVTPIPTLRVYPSASLTFGYRHLLPIWVLWLGVGMGCGLPPPRSKKIPLSSPLISISSHSRNLEDKAVTGRIRQSWRMPLRFLGIACVVWLCTSCASTPRRFAGHYDRLNNLYVNQTVGFSLTIPTGWVIYTKSSDFAVPLQLQPDQEQVLEAYNPEVELGLVLVIQEGPLIEISDLVQKMQAMPAERLGEQFAAANTTNVQPLSLRTTTVSGSEAAEWIYTATDTTGGIPVNMTVSFFILKVGERYVYITFSVPSTRYPMVKSLIDSTLRTFTLTETT
jgi:hypothetical protein